MDPMVAWHNLRNRVELDFYTDPEEEALIESTYLAAGGAPAILNVSTGGDPDNPLADPRNNRVCVFQVVGDWSAPVEISWSALMDGVDNKGAVGTPVATDPVGVATALADFIAGNDGLIAESKGSVVYVRSTTPYRWMTSQCTPEYIPV